MKSIGISILCYLFLAVMCAVPAHAAEKQTVVWSADITEVCDGSATLTVQGKISPGWHIYGFEMPSLGDETGVPDPTSLELYLPAGVVTDGDMMKSGDCTVRFDDFMNLNLPWITGSATFVQKLKVASGASGKIEGTVNYMACTEQACTPPSKYEFSLTFSSSDISGKKVAETSEVVRDVHKDAGAAVEEQVVNADEPERRPVRAAIALAVALAFIAGAYFCFGSCRRFTTLRVVSGFVALAVVAAGLYAAENAMNLSIMGRSGLCAAWCVILTLLSLYLLGKLRFAGDDQPKHITSPRIIAAVILLTMALCLYLSINFTTIQ